MGLTHVLINTTVLNVEKKLLQLRTQILQKIFGPNFVSNFWLHRETIFGPNIIPNCKRNWMCRRLLKGRLHIQFLSRIGIIFGPNIVPLCSKKFGTKFGPNILLHRGTIFVPNKIPNC